MRLDPRTKIAVTFCISTLAIIYNTPATQFPYELAFMVSMAVRFLPLFHEEAVNVLTAVQLRGVELKKIPWGRKTDLYRSLFFPLVYSTLVKARQMSAAMETRAFRVYPERTYMKRLKFCFADYGVILFSLSTTLLLTVMRFNGAILHAASL